MFDLISAGGLLMLPLLFCSLVAIAIIIERSWSLSRARVLPKYALAQVWAWLQNEQLDAAKLTQIRRASPLGRLLSVGLQNSQFGRAAMIDAIEQAASQVVHELERYLEILGTIAAITPLMGLLGTVVGMISVFTEITTYGTGNANALAGGISEALLTTAAGLAVAIPSLVMHRHYTARIESIVVNLEREAIKLVDALHSNQKTEYDLWISDSSVDPRSRSI